MRKIILLNLLLIIPAVYLSAQDNQLDLFKEANGFYEKGQYEKAIEKYLLLTQKNTGNASLYYNLGNAYYKNQQIGYALVNYERAIRIAPRDRDIRYNIDHINYVLKEPPLPLWNLIIQKITDMATLNELTALFLLLYLAFISGIIIFLFTRQQAVLILNTGIFLILIFSAGLLFIKYSYEVSTKWAIVIKGPVEVYNGPGTDNSIGFTLPEGKKVAVLGKKDSWIAIGMNVEGLKGWTEEKYLEKI